ncbi:MAG: hypothetical protein GXX85_00090 [Ignavibacteria bacterium]|nr:hypothetical protein [Ignavibacteria bacterium]
MKRQKTNKIKTAFGLATVIALLIIGCSNSSMENSDYFDGIIIITGNEPFTNPSVQTDSGEVYVINCKKEERQFFFDNQGKNIRIFYSEIVERPQGKTLTLIKYNFIEKDKL